LHEIHFALKKLAAFLLFFLFSYLVIAQEESGFQEYKSFWNKTDLEFKDPEKSPLPENEIDDFDSVPRYDFNPDFLVNAEWIPVDNSKPFYFKTTGEIKQKYRKIGLAKFTLMGKDFELSVFRNLQLSRIEAYKDYLFIPYTDETNGFETYGGGKYISLHAQPTDSIVIDFNQSYNPYCAYNDSYSCPIPPEENFLRIAIPAGAKSDH